MLLKGFWIDGVFFHGSAGFYPRGTSLRFGEASATLPTIGGTGIVQHRWLGGDTPLNLAPVDQDVSFLVTNESDYLRFLEAVERGRPVEIFADVLFVDQWYIPGGNTNQSTWRTSRRLPWSLPGIDHATRPPRVFVETAGVEVEQTVVKVGPPIAGEVVVPETGQVFGDLETHSSLSGDFLKLRYHPIMIAKLSSVRLVYRSTNELRFTCRIDEVLSGTYTPAAIS
jgi:hypothetical protein